jgi:hypothetical protein
MLDTQIRKQAEQRPFRPFAIETNGGTQIHVFRKEDIQISPHPPHLVIIFHTDGSFYAIDPAQVSAIQVL